MTQIFDDRGEVIPVTVIEAGPCYITQKKTLENDGYTAVQLGFEEVKPARVNKPERGHLAKNQLPSLRYLREFRVEDHSDLSEGQKLDASVFEVGDLVDVIGVSKGKGFAGVVKRHHFSGGPRTHGQSDRLRAPGAIGAGSMPNHIVKRLRIAGRMGNDQVTVQNLEIALVDPERNLLAVKGAVPGARDGLLIIRQARKTSVSRKRR